jgi:serine/threonine protein kinase
MIARRSHEKVFEVNGTHGRYALKELRLQRLPWCARSTVEELAVVDRDVRAMSDLKWASSVIASLRDCWLEPDLSRAFLVLDYVPITLMELLAKQREFSLDIVVRWSAQMAVALAAIHKEQFVHCRICPAHVLLTEDLRDAKVACFGLALARVDVGEEDSSSASSELSFQTCASGPRDVASAYCSPEVLAGDRCSPASDVFALGLLFGELLMGMPGRRIVDAAAEARVELGDLVSGLISSGGCCAARAQLATASASMLAIRPVTRPSMQETIQMEPLRGVTKKLAAEALEIRTRLLPP